QIQVVCSDRPIITLVGDDVILPCRLDPATSADSMTVNWTRPGAASSPVVNRAEINSSSCTVVLQCESAGWYPEPELLWLDGEGKLLSAGPPETVRGPDDLYTVSSRVTVEKRHSNTFTCRVQQNNINQSRETRIDVPDDFFPTSSHPDLSPIPWNCKIKAWRL
ncbi:butyrophilin subfamily 2 member A2-like, partial [Stegastes partitus]|uniref:Butyrophilin subfamily 2 member A2-like n=1 Tax=Stegastes partitus TaxID=144197 RepID=A0A9Y4U027_9TELE